MVKLPHPIPYQGSKRNLAPLIGRHIPPGIDVFYEPFAGSAAMTIYAAHHRLANRFIVADTLEPIVALWRAIVTHPGETVRQYREIWEGQSNEDHTYFNRIRSRYNTHKDPVDLLYLICRCVKNAIRFNSVGHFTQSVDKRRLGMHPDKMQYAIEGASFLLRRKVDFLVGDWRDILRVATPQDFVYMDPPYLGTSIGRDKRYHRQLSREALIFGLRELNERSIRFALSYDGMTGDKDYGPPLPEDLGMTRLFLHAGRSSQATLQGKHAETIESLYLSRDLEAPVDRMVSKVAPVQRSMEL